MTPQHARRDRMECAEPWHPFDRAAANRRDAVLHFARRLVGEGDAQDLARPGLASRDQMGEPGGQRGRLAGAGAGQHQHWSFGGEHRFALRLVQALQIGGFRREGRGFRHALEVGGGERIGNRSGDLRRREKVPMVVTDIPVIHRLFPNFSLPQLGAEVHGAWVIGTAVPASPRAGNGTRARQVTKGPISAGRQWKELSGSFRGQPGRGAGRGDRLSRDAAYWSSSELR